MGYRVTKKRITNDHWHGQYRDLGTFLGLYDDELGVFTGKRAYNLGS